MDVEGWSGDFAQIVPAMWHRRDRVLLAWCMSADDTGCRRAAVKADDGPPSSAAGLVAARRSRTRHIMGSSGSRSAKDPDRTSSLSPRSPSPRRKRPWWCFFMAGLPSIQGFMGPGSITWFATGKIVIFPRYQNDVGTLPQDFLANALAAIRDALGVLHDGVGHVRPDPARFALIGHSAGANLAAQIAAVAPRPDSEIPPPQALIALMPGEIIPMPEPALSRILRDHAVGRGRRR